MAAFAVVWGTKGRARPLGARAFLCEGCLEIRKATVYAIERSDHLYLVSIGGWHERLRYQECDVCQQQDQIGPESPMISLEEAQGLSERETLDRTEPAHEVSRIVG